MLFIHRNKLFDMHIIYTDLNLYAYFQACNVSPPPLLYQGRIQDFERGGGPPQRFDILCM